jgi:16S rRNA (cytidine1402-2'-O)-methyltransferase
VRGGTLYVVATPLGHLGDLTARAAELLRSVPLVAAEDTRRTRALLTHLGARPRLVSYHAHSTRRAPAGILAALAAGEDVALVTDAGTPAISDPGSELVQEVRAAGFAVVPLPGPSAVSAALSAGGLPADRYVFLGFLPRKGQERARLLHRIGREEWTTVLFESPARLADLLRDLAGACGGDRAAVVARELTKVHEEFRSGTLGELAAAYETGEGTARGECTILVGGRGQAARDVAPTADAGPLASRLLAAGVSPREAVRLLVDLSGISRNEAYRMVTELRRE